ncbi:MAG TPA: pyridoxamine 5'-phosphate oxidase [bacterium]|nr:pyridoxamine 5'-phosphate oxidase [bacterium]
MNLSDIRRTYTQRELSESAADPDPLRQLQQWLSDALTAQVEEPTAMVLSTVDPDGQPSGRVVLLKGLEPAAPGGLIFYTNYLSRKGQALARSPRAALTFFWPALERQVRIEGTAEAADPALSDAYFQSRPRSSQVGAWASPQSQPVADRAALEQLEAAAAERFADQPTLPRPPHWGGYVVRPHRLEFWQGRPSRLHDRLSYQLQSDGSWLRQRLAP